MGAQQEEEEKVEHEQEGSPGGRGGLVGRRRERGERERRGWRVVERCGGLFDGCGQDGGSEAVRGGPAQAGASRPCPPSSFRARLIRTSPGTAPREGCEGCCQVAQGARRRVQREAREHVGALRHPQGASWSRFLSRCGCSSLCLCRSDPVRLDFTPLSPQCIRFQRPSLRTPRLFSRLAERLASPLRYTYVSASLFST